MDGKADDADSSIRALIFALLALACGHMLSNLDKVFWPEAGITKGDLLMYYREIAAVLVPHLRGRPFTMKRYPDGWQGKHFFQKDSPKHRPSWLHTASFPASTRQGERRVIDYALVDDELALLWMVNMGCIDMHAWSSRADRPERPDWVLFDLDPSDGVGFAEAVEVAQLVKQALDLVGLQGFPKTSGSRGIHVLVPVARRHTYAQAHEFASVIAAGLARANPGLVTTEWTKSKRRGVLVDANQNGAGKTTASVYSVRPRARAPVSAPLRWEGLYPPRSTRPRSRWTRCSSESPVTGTSTPECSRPTVADRRAAGSGRLTTHVRSSGCRSIRPVAVQVSVVGSGAEHEAAAEEVGRLLAERGCTVVTGGGGEVMAAACRGAKRAGGATIGILPGEQRGAANEWVDHVIVTGIGHAGMEPRGRGLRRRGHRRRWELGDHGGDRVRAPARPPGRAPGARARSSGRRPRGIARRGRGARARPALRLSLPLARRFRLAHSDVLCAVLAR